MPDTAKQLLADLRRHIENAIRTAQSLEDFQNPDDSWAEEVIQDLGEEVASKLLELEPLMAEANMTGAFQ